MTVVLVNGRAATVTPADTCTVATSTATLGSGQSVTKFTPTPNVGRAGVLLGQGAYNRHSQWTSDSGLLDIATAICAAGFPCIAGDIGSQVNDEDGLPDTLWGNDAAVSYVDELDAYLTASMGASTARVLVAESGRGADLLSWAAHNLSDVGGFFGIVPATDTQELHDTNPLMPTANIALSIEGAGTSPLSGWYPTHSPLRLAQSGALAGLRYRAYYGTADTVVSPTSVLAIADALHGRAVATAGNHFSVQSLVPVRSVVQFVKGADPAFDRDLAGIP